MKSVIIKRGHGLISRRQREGAQRFDPVQFVQSKVLGEKNADHRRSSGGQISS